MDDPHENYAKLIQTRDFLKSVDTVHENFYDIHIMYITKYLEVLQITDDCDQTAAQHLHSLIIQYDCNRMFDLNLYLDACELLIKTIHDYELQKTFETMGFS